MECIYGPVSGLANSEAVGGPIRKDEKYGPVTGNDHRYPLDAGRSTLGLPPRTFGCSWTGLVHTVLPTGGRNDSHRRVSHAAIGEGV